MATPNPMGDGSAVVPSIPGRDHPFLRSILTAARDGLREDLDRFGDRLRCPLAQLLKEEAVYGTLIDALDGARIHPDREVCAVLRRLAQSVDHHNEYGRVVAEHDALRRLLDQIERAAH